MSLFRIFRRAFSTEYFGNLIKESEGFEQVLKKVKFIKAENGHCVVELKVGEEDTNPMLGLHGGLSATLADAITSYALITDSRCPTVPSVSADLHITYLKGATIGDELIIDGTILKVGRTLAYLECTIINKSTGDLLVKASHTKYLIHPKQ